MKIKRYMADSMRAALAQVRAEQGPDAVILSSRRLQEGIEVIAAVDYDEALFADAALKRAVGIPSLKPEPEPEALLPAAPAAVAVRTAPAAAPRRPAATAVSTRSATPPPMVAAAARPAVAQTSVSPRHPNAPPAPSSDSGFTDMQRQLKDMRDMLQSGLAHMAWNEKRLREPLQARVLEVLTGMDIAADVAASLAILAPRRTSVENPEHIPLALLARHLPVVDNLSTVTGGVIALVGPTGAGKTTTIAKLAARWSMEHGSQDLALVSTDGYRIGAREQLLTYARILGAPMHVANSGKELARVLERLKSKKLILIDTAGMGPRDVRLSEQLAALQLGAARARVLLALPAHAEAHALEEIVRSFARVSPVASILTKVDEAASLGAAFSTSLRHKLKIAYLCTGQRVPEDLHAAHSRRLWLIRVAMKLRQVAEPRANDAYHARHFGQVPAHA